METPIRKQYLEAKRQYPDALLFFRLGDFYETFEEDARIVAQELDIALTSREMGRGIRVPLAGVPAQSLQLYLGKLVRKGYRVAICEQMADPATVRGIVPREVVRVVSAGTLTEPELLRGEENNYLVALVWEATAAGLAYVDVSTGEFRCTQWQGSTVKEDVLAELRRLQPAELIVPEDRDLRFFAGPVGVGQDDILTEWCVSQQPRWLFLASEARNALEEQYEVTSLEAFGCAGFPFAIQAAGALVRYLQAHQAATLKTLRPLVTYSTRDVMVIDPTASRSLEIWQDARGGTQGALIGILAVTKTAMGGRLLRQRLGQPLLRVEEIEQRLDIVATFAEHSDVRIALRTLFSQIPDLERLAARVRSHTVTPRELGILRGATALLPQIEALLKDMVTVRTLVTRLPRLVKLHTLLVEALVDDPPNQLGEHRTLREGFVPELDHVLDEAREARNWLVSLETREKEKTGIKSLKVGYNKVFGYYIEISHANTALVPPEYRRKQTLANAERYVTQELEERERIVLQSEERFQQLERDRYAQLLLELERWVADLREAAVIVAELDVAAALADIAIRSRWVRPVLCTDPILKITGGRHPMVEAGLPSGAFIPNDTLLDHEGCQIALITGPNMAGKSTYLRQTALIVLLAQIGSFVPAESACVGIVDRIFTRVGAHDDLFSGQSTFMVEMLELGHMLHHATPHSLLILDEIGRGTSTYDGLAIAQATIEYLHHEPHVQCRTLFATHYQELTALADVLPRLRNFSVAVEEVGERVVFLHKIVPGSADRSYGIHVARLAGVPRALTRRAQEILGNLEHQAGIRERRGRVRQLRGEIHDALQLSILTPPDPLVEELAHLDIMTMSPLEALQQLFALHEQAVKRLKPS